jgi:putative nucleotidyltransferase with HDIG domain
MAVPRRTISLPHPLLASVAGVADRLGADVYVVGGYVRDLLLGTAGNDLDFVVLGDAIPFAREVAHALDIRTMVTFERFGTAMVPTEQGKLEFVGARSEKYSADSRKPQVFSGSLQDDLRRRDFTVNAMAAAITGDSYGVLIDAFDGEADLGRKLLRTPLDPVETFDDDPLRMMRAIRFASQLGFAIEENTLRAVHEMKDRLNIVSQERLTEEFLKMLRSPQPSVALKLMFDTGVLHLVFPEIAQMAGVDQRREHHHKDVFLHTCKVVDNISQITANVWLRFVALVHDIAKPKTKAYKEGIGWTFHGHEEIGARMMKKIFQRLRLPTAHLPYVEKLVRLHLRPQVLVDDGVTDAAIRRVMFEAGPDVEDLMILCKADITSKNPGLVQKYLGNYEQVMAKMKEVEEKDRIRNWQPPVKGDEIMAVCGLAPGRKVGELKQAIEDAILDGKIPNEHDAALAYLVSVKDQILGRNS